MGGLGIAPGIYFDRLTRKEENKLGGITSTTNTTIMDLNIPIMLNYKLSFGDDFAIFAFAGPDIVLGLSAKSVTVTKVEGVSGEDKDDYNYYKKEDGANEPALTRFDMGLMFGAGVQFTHFRVEAGYELGLLNRLGEKEYSNKVGSWKGSEKFNRFFVGIGYAF